MFDEMTPNEEWALFRALDKAQFYWTGKLMSFSQLDDLAEAFQRHFLSDDYVNLASSRQDFIADWLVEYLLTL